MIGQQIQSPARSNKMGDLLGTLELLLTLLKCLFRPASNADLILQFGIRVSQLLCTILDPYFNICIGLIKSFVPLFCVQ